MLTITAPIELKCKAPENSMHEGFYHRIADQYSMMSTKLTPEDLLHVVTTPPEYYFGGEDETNIFQQMNVNTHQENKLEVINNLVNRIMVSGSAELTYQDRVYITDVLQKLGVRNVSEFMHQVHLLRQEQHDTSQLIDLYWNHAGDLRQLVENYRTEQKNERLTEELIEQKETLHLHEDILNRLQTAAIYQTVVNFNSHRHNDQSVTNEELAISEQYRVAQNILLQKLKSAARGEETPLVFRHENFYEDQQFSEEQITEENVLSQISSAVLLNLVDNIYQSRSEQKIRGGDSWYHMEQAFYQNAGNTMQRIENRISSKYETAMDTNQIDQSYYHELQKNEISMMNQLFEVRTSEQYQTVSELLRQDLLQQELVNRITEINSDQQFLEQSEEIVQSRNYQDRSSQVMYRLLDKHISEIDQSNQQMLTQITEQLRQELTSDQHVENRFRQTDVHMQEGNVSQEQRFYDQSRDVTEEQIVEPTEQIIERRQDQVSTQEKYLQTAQGIRETIERAAARAQEESARALRESKDRGSENAPSEQTNVTISQGDVFEGDVTTEQNLRVDHNHLSNIEQELSRINRENINNQYKYMQMMEGIRESMERPQEQKTPDQMRRESLMALEHPAELMDQLRAEGQELQQAKQEKLTQVLKILPEQTRAVYETVREYLEAPMELRKEMTGVSDDMGMLIRDIHEAQIMQKQTELVHKQQEQLHEQTKEVIDRWNEKTPVEPQKKQVYEDRRTDVTLVHRSQEQQVDEELIQQMIRQNNQVNRTVHSQNETVTNYDTTERKYTNVNTQRIVEQTENVNELVRQGVQRELGALSEKIYRKLEKRLESEKRRRGY